MLTITDLNAEFAKLKHAAGPDAADDGSGARGKPSLARLMPYRDGTIFIAKFAGSGALGAAPEGR